MSSSICLAMTRGQDSIRGDNILTDLMFDGTACETDVVRTDGNSNPHTDNQADDEMSSAH